MSDSVRQFSDSPTVRQFRQSDSARQCPTVRQTGLSLQLLPHPAGCAAQHSPSPACRAGAACQPAGVGDRARSLRRRRVARPLVPRPYRPCARAAGADRVASPRVAHATRRGAWEETVCGGGRARCVAPAYINGLSRWALMGIALRDMHMRHATACVSRRVTSLIRHRSSTSSALGLASWACCQPLVTVCARVLSRVLAVLRHFYLYERAEGSYESARRTGGSGRGAL